MTPNGEDFEAFIGAEKAKEFKALFSAWIAQIYRMSCFLLSGLGGSDPSPAAESDWHYYSPEKSTASDDVPTADLSSEGGDDAMDCNEGGSGINLDVQQPQADEAPETILAFPSSVTDRDSTQSVATEPTAPDEVEAISQCPLLDLPDDSRPASPNEVSTRVAKVTDHEEPRLPDRRTLSNQSHSLVTLSTLVNARGSQWMKSKKTLAYFHGAYKMGKLGDVILHWYQLEEALGFQESVSCLTTRLEALY